MSKSKKKKPAPKHKPLSDKQKRFCEEYLIDFNATQAAIRAGYSKKTARQQGSRLLSNVDIQEYLKEIRGVLKERSLVTAESITRELEDARIMAMDIAKPSAAVTASSTKAKLHGLYEIDNAQKGAARSEELERLLAIAAGGDE